MDIHLGVDFNREAPLQQVVARFKGMPKERVFILEIFKTLWKGAPHEPGAHT